MKYHREIISKVVKAFNPSFKFAALGALKGKSFHDSELHFGKVNRIETYDQIGGQQDGLDFTFALLNVKEVMHKEGAVGVGGYVPSQTFHTSTFFGIRYNIELPASIGGDVFVMPLNDRMKTEADEQAVSNLIHRSQALHTMMYYPEDPDFSRQYSVFSTDQFLAMELLSERMKEMLLEIRKFFGTNVAYAFRGKRLYIHVDRFKGLFDAGTNFRITEQKMQEHLDELVGYMSVIGKVADVFKTKELKMPSSSR